MSNSAAVDPPIALADLLDLGGLGAVLDSFAGFHGVGFAVVDAAGKVLARSSSGELPTKAWKATPIVHQGAVLGAVLAGPGDDNRGEVLAHASRVVDAMVQSQIARHSTAARLAQAVERLQELDRLKSSFLATVSHELRTPLTSVIGYSEMLLEGLAGALNQEQRDYVQTIMEKGDQLLQLITGILDVSRIEAGTFKIAHDPVDLRELIEVTITAVSSQARRKGLEVRVTRAASPRVVGDREKIRQILLNLLGNAIKFTPEGGKVEVEIGVGAIVRDDEHPVLTSPHFAQGSSDPARDGKHLGIRMRVIDSGIGIAPEKQGRIFEPFFQVDSSSTREYGGTGLGLALVKSYVEAHGGKVWVDSDLGRGSVFTVSFPAVEDDLSAWLRSVAARSAERTRP